MKKTILTIAAVCALQSGAQTFSTEYEGMVDKAEADIRASRWREAEGHILGALRAEPANSANFLLWSNLGIVRSHLGDYAGAVEAFSVGLAKAPRSTVLLTNRANAYLAMEMRKEALDDLDLALQTDSVHQGALRTRGIVRLSAGDIPGAEEDLGTLERNYPEDATSNEGLGDIALMRGEKETAAGQYAKAWEKAKEESVAVKLGLLLLEENEEEKLDKLVREALKEYPKSARLTLLRGALAKKRHLAREAEADRKKAIALGADRETVEDIMGRE